MKDVNRKRLIDLINDGLDYEDIMGMVEQMQCEEDEEENDQVELEVSMEDASDALAYFFVKGLNMYGLAEDELDEVDLRDNIMETLEGIVNGLKKASELKKNLAKSKDELTEEDLKKLLDVLFK